MAAPVFLYDGVCVLCSRVTRYVLRHDTSHTIRFVAIQSEEGRALAQPHGIDPDNPQSFLFIDCAGAHAKFDGVLALVRQCGGPARLLIAARFIPRPMRDWLYDRVARNRYAIFGRSSACIMPDAANRHRFSLPGTP